MVAVHDLPQAIARPARRAPWRLPCAFGLALLVYSAGSYYLTFFLTFFTAVAVFAALGIVALLWGLIRLWQSRDKAHTLSLAGVLVIWLIWFVAPVSELGLHFRLALEAPMRKQALAELAQSSPACVKTGQCMVSNQLPGYIVFPWGGMLSDWLGVVYAPHGQIEAFTDKGREEIAEDISCEPQPVAENLYLCHFY